MSPDPTLDVWSVDWRSLTPDQAGDLRSFLSPEETARAARFHRPDDQNRSAIGRGLLRYLSGELLQLDSCALVFETEPRGKPYICEYSDQLKVNLSHSGDWIVLALSTGAPIGVDIQEHRAKVDMSGVASLSMHPVEQTWLDETPDEPTRQLRFFAIWALREAALKATGDGFFADRTGLNTLPAPTGWGRRAFGDGMWLDLAPLPAAPAYSAALARVADENAPPEPELFSRADLPARFQSKGRGKTP